MRLFPPVLLILVLLLISPASAGFSGGGLLDYPDESDDRPPNSERCRA